MRYRLQHTVRKMLLVPLALFAVSTITVGQINIAVAPTKMNVLYIGVDNPVAVATSGAADDKVTVTVSGGGGTVVKTGAGLYNVRVSSVTDECQVNVFVNGTLAGSSSFRVRTLPPPAAAVGGFSSGAHISADALRTQPGVGMYLKDFPFETKYEVLSFTLTVPDDKGVAKSADCQGAAFSPLAKQYLDQYATPGQIITISNIWVEGPEGRKLKLPALLYYIK